MSASRRQTQQPAVKVDDQYLGIANVELPQFSGRDRISGTDFC